MPTSGVLSVANVLGTGFTLYKSWEISVDLRLNRNSGGSWMNVFQFTADNKAHYNAGNRVPSVFQHPDSKGFRLIIAETFLMSTRTSNKVPSYTFAATSTVIGIINLILKI